MFGMRPPRRPHSADEARLATSLRRPARDDTACSRHRSVTVGALYGVWAHDISIGRPVGYADAQARWAMQRWRNERATQMDGGRSCAPPPRSPLRGLCAEFGVTPAVRLEAAGADERTACNVARLVESGRQES